MVIGLGMDIQEIIRIERAMRQGGKSFLDRTFTPGEITYCKRKKHFGQHFTGRFCAKEAFFKALGTGWAKGVKWSEVEVLRKDSGCPEIKLSGKTAKLASRAGVEKIWLSITHSQAYAAATVVLEG
jgi:holo-[acyl-carrier protein] synthase